MLNFVISVLGIFLTIFLVIGIHEFGHFITARLCGIKVLRFSIGFGKTLWRRVDKSGTEYVFAAIPLGGYIKMLDEGEDKVPAEELHLAYNQQPIYKRIAVIIAGPLANFIFAAVLYWLLFVIGFITVIPITGKITPNSVAAVAGMQAKQEIITIDNAPVSTWYAIAIKLLEHTGDQSQLPLQTQNLNSKQINTYSLNLANWQMNELKPDPLTSLGIKPFQPEIAPIIAVLAKDSPAAKAGLQVGDKIISINNQPILDWMDLITLINTAPEKTFTFVLTRAGKTITLPVTVGSQRSFFKKRGFLGVSPNVTYPKELLREEKYTPGAAVIKAIEEVRNFTRLNFMIIGKMLSGKVSVQSLGGPITIFENAGNALNHGLTSFLSFLAFLSISIGVINVLPIPGLDGGHLLFQLIEFVRGKPLSERTLAFCYRIGLIALFLLIIQSVANDLMRL